MSLTTPLHTVHAFMLDPDQDRPDITSPRPPHEQVMVASAVQIIVPTVTLRPALVVIGTVFRDAWSTEVVAESARWRFDLSSAEGREPMLAPLWLVRDIAEAPGFEWVADRHGLLMRGIDPDACDW